MFDYLFIVFHLKKSKNRTQSFFDTILLLILLGIYVTNPYFLSAQGLNNLWLTGYYSYQGIPCGGTRINFSATAADTAYDYRDMNLEQTDASISDSAGNLLFYTNGAYIANRTGDTMVNGNGLNPSSYTTTWAYYGLRITQGDIIIPIPDDSLRYYLFHETLEYTSTSFHTFELLYSIIDMTMDSGRGAVVQKNVPIIQDTLMVGGVAACKHANGRDWWVMLHKFRSNTWYTLLVTKFGILGPFSQSIGPVFNANDLEEGQVAFSPDGSKYVRNERNTDLDIYDFDRCTGYLSNNIHIAFNDTTSGVGVSFSANSKVLYVDNNKYLFQFDLTSANIPATLDTIGVFDNFSDPGPPFYAVFYLSQLAPDGKIYINTGNGTSYLHVINSPDSLGVACNFQQHSFKLPTYNANSIPNYPNYFLQAQGGTLCDSLGLPNGFGFLSIQSLTLDIIPNPVISNNISIVYSPLPETSSLSIIDITGKLVSQCELPHWSTFQNLKLPAIVPGIYFAQRISKSGTTNTKFIVQ